MQVPELFLDRIEPEPSTGCWLWSGYCNPKGYGLTSWRGRTHMAHRAVWEATVGPLPPAGTGRNVTGEMTMDHLCRQRCCVNPAHMRVVTHRENVLAGSGLAAKAAKRTFCPKCGGQLDSYLPPNRPRPARICRACNRSYLVRYRAQKREAAQ